MKKLATVVIALLILGFLGWLVWRGQHQSETELMISSPPDVQAVPERRVIGHSVGGREIEAYSYGNGPTHLLFVGGIHGGYEWNSVYLAHLFLDFFEAKPETIPANLRVTVIPSLNPDGVAKVIGKEGRFALEDAPPVAATVPGRFNLNGVDLNRNFDCNWQATSTWRGREVSAGRAPFSEPEALALHDLVLAELPAAVVFWHSQANAVYPGECGEGISAATRSAMNAYSRGSGYPAIDEFDSYEITGAAEGWLAKLGIPALTVELKTHETIEWEQNLAGVQSLFDHFSKNN